MQDDEQMFNTALFLQGYARPIIDDWRARRAPKQKDPYAIPYQSPPMLMGSAFESSPPNYQTSWQPPPVAPQQQQVAQVPARNPYMGRGIMGGIGGLL